MEKIKNKFGLLGRNISYSFSSGYFTEKFKKLNLQAHKYVNFDIPVIQDFSSIIKTNKYLKGMNVTIPYKQEVMHYLDALDETAKEIGAVNTIKFLKNGGIKGYNTDVYGFENSIKPFLKSYHTKALILGTGGASKAVAFSLKKNKIDFKFVSRVPSAEHQISYNDFSEEILSEYKVIVNCSPIGTYPNINDAPNIPYEFITEKHLLFDLIYNPEETAFLKNGKKRGATIKNGYEMLELQAEESWRIWNDF